jgi:hypothetical protein
MDGAIDKKTPVMCSVSAAVNSAVFGLRTMVLFSKLNLSLALSLAFSDGWIKSPLDLTALP